jgi:hypothetical protein
MLGDPDRESGTVSQGCWNEAFDVGPSFLMKIYSKKATLTSNVGACNELKWAWMFINDLCFMAPEVVSMKLECAAEPSIYDCLIIVPLTIDLVGASFHE